MLTLSLDRFRPPRTGIRGDRGLTAVTGRPARVLVVDDEPHERQLLQVMLRAEGFDIICASGGAEALAMVAADPPDLILLDVMMPEMDGYQFAEAIRLTPEARNIPIIMITALGERDARLQGLKAGAADFHTKPIDRAVLAIQMKNLVSLKEHGSLCSERSGRREHDAGLQAIALRDEYDLVRRCLDTAGIMLVWLDMAGRITRVNRFACNLLGWSESELIGQSWAATCLPRGTRKGVLGLPDDIATDDSFGTSSCVVTRHGETRLIEWRNTAVHDGRGRCIGTFSSGTDITEWNSAIHELRNAEERMRFALQNANVGVWDADHVTGVVHWSDVMEKHFGVAPGTFSGTFQAFVERVHPDDQQVVITAIEQATRSGAAFSIEHRILLPDGGVRWLVAAGKIQADEAGRRTRAIGISQDITERRELERLYGQSQKMEGMGQLVFGVAHDFNNLLSVILGCAELVAQEASANPRSVSDVGELIKAAVRAQALTRQLLAFGREQVVSTRPLNLNTLVTGMAGMLGRLIGPGVEIVLALAPDLPLVVADNGQLEQVVMNLVINARDAMDGSGILTIETRVAENPSWPDEPAMTGRYVVLAITDTGTGMTNEIKRRILEPFFTTKPEGRGTGLGLSTVARIVKQSKGHLQIASERNRGSTFTVCLPCAEMQPR